MTKAKYRPCFTTRITSPFGMRTHPITKKPTMHNGIDLSPLDKVKYFQEPIIAIADGVVTMSSFSSVLGNQVRTNHSTYESRNYHLAKRLVNVGDKVKAGQVIGLMGSTGSSTAQHLHFEIRIGAKAVNPIPYIKDLDFFRRR